MKSEASEASICILLEKDAEVTIDLNGNTINKNFTISSDTLNGGSLTIVDTSAERRGGIILEGSIAGGTFDCRVKASGSQGITGGVFTENAVIDQYTGIGGGTFYCPVKTIKDLNGGIFYGDVETNHPISGGTFYGDVTTTSTISGGTFYGDVHFGEGHSIKGGTFYGMKYYTGGLNVDAYEVNFYIGNSVYANQYVPKTGTNAGKVTEIDTSDLKLTTGDSIESRVADWLCLSQAQTPNERPSVKRSVNETWTSFDFDNTIISSDIELCANIELTIPYTLKVEQKGNVAPPSDSYSLEIIGHTFVDSGTSDGEYVPAQVKDFEGYDITVSGNSVTTDKTVDGDLLITGRYEELSKFIAAGSNDGLYIYQKEKTPSAGWDYADEIWFVKPQWNTDIVGSPIEGSLMLLDIAAVNNNDINQGGNVDFTNKVHEIFAAEYDKEAGYRVIEHDVSSVYYDKMTFTNTYTEATGGGSGGHSYSTVYTVKFDSNGGTPVADKTLTSITGKVLEGVTAPTFEGKSFTGWTYEGAAVSDENSFYDLTKNFTTTTITLTAQWQDTEETPTGKEDGGDKPQAGKNDNEKDEPAKETSEVPKTGDSSNMTMWLALILAAGAGMTVITYTKRKNADK